VAPMNELDGLFVASGATGMVASINGDPCLVAGDVAIPV
jgi:hypothetical protein